MKTPLKLALAVAIGATIGAITTVPTAALVPSKPYVLYLANPTEADALQCRHDRSCLWLGALSGHPQRGEWHVDTSTIAHAPTLADCYDDSGEFTGTDICNQLMTGKDY